MLELLLLSVRWSLLQGLPVEAGLQVRCAHTLQLLLLHPRSGDLEAVVGTLDQVFPDTLALSWGREVLRGVVRVRFHGGATAKSAGNLGDDSPGGALAALLSPVGHARETHFIVENVEPVFAVGVSTANTAVWACRGRRAALVAHALSS